MSTRQPIAVGRCLVHTEYFRSYQVNPTKVASTVGVRIMSPSATDEGAHTPASDVYLVMTDAADVQRLAAYFSDLARKMQRIEE